MTVRLALVALGNHSEDHATMTLADGRKITLKHGQHIEFSGGPTLLPTEVNMIHAGEPHGEQQLRLFHFNKHGMVSDVNVSKLMQFENTEE